MDPTTLATSLITMSAAKTQVSASMAVLKKQFEMEKSAIDMLLPTSSPPAAPGTGRLVDKTA